MTHTERPNMKISDAYPSNYLKASDLQGRNVLIKMDRVEVEKIGDDEKPVLYFVGKPKGIVLNKTNAANIATFCGDDTDDWRDQEIVLFAAMVDFQGKTVEAIRVRMPQPKDRKSAAPAQRQTPQRQVGGVSDNISTGRPIGNDAMDDEIPFNAEFR
jgi:hypothetical protein